MTTPAARLTAITTTLDAAQTEASRIAEAAPPATLSAAVAVGLQHALECAQVQALILQRLLATAPPGQGQPRDNDGTTPCPPNSAAPA